MSALGAPVSVEWTAPYEASILHFGIHNLPPCDALVWMSAMARYTAAPDERLLVEILSELEKIPEVLIVLNHPFWLEEGVEEANHRRALDRLLRECIPWLHAFELNGTRRWEENAAVVELAQRHSRPVISGGDRHACEPAACLNLTNAECFADFASEIRSGRSSVLFMPQYKTPMPVRVLEAVWEILRNYPKYRGHELWTDRVFYRNEDGQARPLSSLWRDARPWLAPPLTGLVQFFGTAGVRGALRFLLSRRAEVLP